MFIEKGSGRTAILLGNIAIKIARLYLIHQLKLYLSRKRKIVFGGMADNISEFNFYRSHKSSFVVPVYFSLFGLISIYRRAEVDRIIKMITNSDQGKHVVLNQIQKIIGSDFWNCLSELTIEERRYMCHHLYNFRNYGEINGRLVLVDYPHSILQKFIKKYGEKISREFKFSNAS